MRYSRSQFSFDEDPAERQRRREEAAVQERERSAGVERDKQLARPSRASARDEDEPGEGEPQDAYSTYHWLIEHFDRDGIETLTTLLNARRSYSEEREEREEPGEDRRARRKLTKDDPPPFRGRPERGGKLTGDSLDWLYEATRHLGTCPDYRPETPADRRRAGMRGAMMANDTRRVMRHAYGVGDDAAEAQRYEQMFGTSRIGHV